MSDVTPIKNVFAHCRSTNLFNRYGAETNRVYGEFLEMLMKFYRATRQYDFQTMAQKVDDEMHYACLRQFILNLAPVAEKDWLSARS